MFTQNESIDFIKGVYTLWEGEKIPDEIQKTLESEIGILIFQGVIAISGTILKEKEAQELERMLKNDEPMHKIVGFLEKEIPNFEILVKDIGSIVMKIVKEKE